MIYYLAHHDVAGPYGEHYADCTMIPFASKETMLKFVNDNIDNKQYRELEPFCQEYGNINPQQLNLIEKLFKINSVRKSANNQVGNEIKDHPLMNSIGTLEQLEVECKVYGQPSNGHFSQYHNWLNTGENEILGIQVVVAEWQYATSDESKIIDTN